MLSLYVKSHILKGRLEEFLKSEKGQGMVEYSMIIGLVSIGVLLLLGGMSGQIGKMFETITTELGKAQQKAAPTPP